MPFIAAGSYGCVFRPALRCRDDDDNSKKPSTRTVGKVFLSREQFDIERRRLETIRALDPRGTFTLLYVRTCDVGPPYRATDGAEHCPHLKSSRVPQIIMHNGGRGLDRYITPRPISLMLFRRFFRLMIPILEGVERLALAGWVHQDIKPENLLYNQERLFLIDFGIMTPAVDVYSETNALLGVQYLYFPPEYLLAHARLHPDKVSFATADDFVRAVHNHSKSIRIAGEIVPGPDWGPLLARRLWGPKGREFQATALRELYRDFQLQDAQRLLQLVRRIDTYQLGMTLFLTHLASDTGHGERPDDDADLRDLLGWMLHPNPFRRPDVATCLPRFRALAAQLGGGGDRHPSSSRRPPTAADLTTRKKKK